VAVSKRLRYEILRRDNFTCRYCMTATPGTPLRVDHVVPVALGGTDDATNLVTSCEPCNSGKTSTVPDSPLVTQVKEDAMRWQMAWAVAIAEAETEGQQRAKDIAKVKKNYTAAYRGRHGTAPDLPEGWEASVGRWLDLGLPLTLIDKAIASAVGRDKIPARDRFAYFAGCCWSLLRELANRTQELAEQQTETWLDRFERTILDAAVMTWREAWMEQFSCDPEPGMEEEVRKNATSLFPEHLYAGELLNTAMTAALFRSTDLQSHVKEMDSQDEEDEEDPFGIHLVKSVYLGWFTDDPDCAPTMTPESWAEVCRRAWAAKFAGYDEISICEAAFWAGRSHDPGSLSLHTLEESIQLHGDYLLEHVQKEALTKDELDQYAKEAQADEQRRRALKAERGSDDVPNFDWGSTVSDASGHTGGEA
jgi:HNH endonuclease